MPGAPNEKVQIVPFAVHLRLASKGGDQTYSWFELNLDEAEDWGPYLVAITAHTDTRAPSDEFAADAMEPCAWNGQSRSDGDQCFSG